MRAVYEADFGWNKKDECIWSSSNILAKSFDEAYLKAKKEQKRITDAGIKGVQLVSLRRKDAVDIG